MQAVVVENVAHAMDAYDKWLGANIILTPEGCPQVVVLAISAAQAGGQIPGQRIQDVVPLYVLDDHGKYAAGRQPFGNPHVPASRRIKLIY
jgi:hypothetical protein